MTVCFNTEISHYYQKITIDITRLIIIIPNLSPSVTFNRVLIVRMMAICCKVAINLSDENSYLQLPTAVRPLNNVI